MTFKHSAMPLSSGDGNQTSLKVDGSNVGGRSRNFLLLNHWSSFRAKGKDSEIDSLYSCRFMKRRRYLSLHFKDITCLPLALRSGFYGLSAVKLNVRKMGYILCSALFGIHIPILYGEGKEHALRRLLREIRSTPNDDTGALLRRGGQVETENDPLKGSKSPSEYLIEDAGIIRSTSTSTLLLDTADNKEPNSVSQELESKKRDQLMGKDDSDNAALKSQLASWEKKYDLLVANESQLGQIAKNLSHELHSKAGELEETKKKLQREVEMRRKDGKELQAARSANRELAETLERRTGALQAEKDKVQSLSGDQQHTEGQNREHGQLAAETVS